MSEEELTFEEFNRHIDESHDEGCGMCFSFHHYAHLDPAARKIAYLGFLGRKKEYVQSLTEELERREKDPIDDNIYFMINGLEPFYQFEDPTLRDRCMIQIVRRANEMVRKKMATAWVGVRAYAWMANHHPHLD